MRRLPLRHDLVWWLQELTLIYIIQIIIFNLLAFLPNLVRFMECWLCHVKLTLIDSFMKKVSRLTLNPSVNKIFITITFFLSKHFFVGIFSPWCFRCYTWWCPSCSWCFPWCSRWCHLCSWHHLWCSWWCFWCSSDTKLVVPDVIFDVPDGVLDGIPDVSDGALDIPNAEFGYADLISLLLFILTASIDNYSGPLLNIMLKRKNPLESTAIIFQKLRWYIFVPFIIFT